MKRTTKRRLLALALPLPVLAIGAAFAQLSPPGLSVRVALAFPSICAFYLLAMLGVKSMAAAIAMGLGYWYLLLSLVSYSLLCGRDRVSKAVLICVLATTAVVIGLVYVLRGYNPD